MGTVILMRHGQASFGAADYDQLSPLGHRQSVQLGHWLSGRRPGFEAVLTGTLRRHRQSLAGFREGWGRELPEAIEWSELNEYDSESLLRCVSAQPLPVPLTPEVVRQHFRLLRDALLAWMAGEIAPEGMPSHADWLAGQQRALRSIQHLKGGVLVVTSGGPISSLVGALLQAPASTTVALNLRLRNASTTELEFNPQRFSLLSFNGVAHLDDPALAGWITAT